MRERKPTPPWLRWLAGMAGAASGIGGFLMLRDGEALLGVPSRNTAAPLTWVRVDTMPELVASALVFGCICVVFLLAAAKPAWLWRIPLVPMLATLVFLLLLGLAYGSAGG